MLDRKTADNILNEIMNMMVDFDMEVMKKMTLFARIQNIVYANTDSKNEPTEAE